MANEYFDPIHDNRLARCVELELSERQGTDTKSLTLLSEVRCGVARLVSDRFTARVSVSEVELTIDIEGGAISPQSRYGERIRPIEDRIDTTTNESRTTEINAHLGGEILADSKLVTGSKGSAGAAIKKTITRKTAKDSKVTEIVSRVQAVGGNCWIIRENDGKILDGTYLRDEALCRVSSNTGIKKVTAVASVAKRNVKIVSVTNNETGSAMRLTTNRQKILQLLIANSLSVDGDLIQISESILVARSEA